MNFTIRLASVAALVTFWLAAIVWTVLIVAAPANAQTGASDSTSSASTDVAASVKSEPSDEPQKPEPIWIDKGLINSKVGSAPTPNVSNTGGAVTSSTPNNQRDNTASDEYLGADVWARQFFSPLP